MSLFDDASLVLTPNGYKGGVTTGKLYSIKPTSGLGDMTVVRATTATRVNSAGLIESVAINVPRLDYPPLGGCPKILVEPLRTNVVLRSEEFDNAYWVKTNTTITANSSTSPNGTSTADILVENSTSNVVFGVRANPRPSGLTLTTTYSVSFFAKKITRNFCYYDDFNGFQNPIVKVFFNLQTGLVGNTSAGVLNPKMENYGNGWYRCSFQFVATSATGTSIDYRIASATTDNVSTYTGVIGQQAIAIWGAQLEAGSTATSYIPTTIASVTRNADVISQTGISSLINSQAGTMFIEASALANNTTARFIELNDGTTSALTNNVYFRYEPTANTIAYTVFTGGVLQCNISYSLPLTQTANNKMAFVWALNRFEIWVNGSKVAQDTLGITPANLTLSKIIFSDRAGANNFEGNLKSLQLYKTALDNAQLTTLTTL
jgi:hypothetical protein